MAAKTSRGRALPRDGSTVIAWSSEFLQKVWCFSIRSPDFKEFWLFCWGTWKGRQKKSASILFYVRSPMKILGFCFRKIIYKCWPTRALHEFCAAVGDLSIGFPVCLEDSEVLPWLDLWPVPLYTLLCLYTFCKMINFPWVWCAYWLTSFKILGIISIYSCLEIFSFFLQLLSVPSSILAIFFRIFFCLSWCCLYHHLCYLNKIWNLVFNFFYFLSASDTLN